MGRGEGGLKHTPCYKNQQRQNPYILEKVFFSLLDILYTRTKQILPVTNYRQEIHLMAMQAALHNKNKLNYPATIMS